IDFLIKVMSSSAFVDSFSFCKCVTSATNLRSLRRSSFFDFDFTFIKLLLTIHYSPFTIHRSLFTIKNSSLTQSGNDRCPSPACECQLWPQEVLLLCSQKN